MVLQKITLLITIIFILILGGSIELSQTKSAEAEISKKEWSGHIEWSWVKSETGLGDTHGSVQDGGKAQFSFTILDNGAVSGYGTGSEQINHYSEVCPIIDSNSKIKACGAEKWHNLEEGSSNFNFTVQGVSSEPCPDQKFKSCVKLDFISPSFVTYTNTGNMPGQSGQEPIVQPYMLGEYAIFVVLRGYNSDLLELKDGASLHYQSDDGTESINIELNGPSNQFKIKGKVTDINGNPLSESKIFIADYDKMPKINGDENSQLQKLSRNKETELREVKITNDDGTYEFSVEKPADKPYPKLVVGSVLWYKNDLFAVTNADTAEGRKIPIYIVQCIDKDDSTKDTCIQWEEKDGTYEADINFKYGDRDTTSKYYALMEQEEWQTGSNHSLSNLMADGGVIYYNSALAMKYFKDVGSKIGAPPESPVIIHIHDIKDPECVDKPRAAFFVSDENFDFGGLGVGLKAVPTSGGTIHICDLDSSYEEVKDAPKNREWHELSHYFQNYMYLGNNHDQSKSKNHYGYENPTSNDSIIEGFAEFTAMLISEYYGDKYPYKYPIDTARLNLEEDYQVWGNRGYDAPRKISGIGDKVYEEMAVAGILWDLHDYGKEISLVMSKVYPQSSDDVSLDAQTILGTINQKRPLNVVDLYDAFKDSAGKNNTSMIFINHGAFDDVVKRDYIQDSSSEKPGHTGSTSDPTRLTRESPRPLLTGSYLVTNQDSMLKIDVIHEHPFENYSFSYQINTTANTPFYFEMPPPYFPSKAVISQIMSDGKVMVQNATSISSDEYWNYIDSNPKEDAVFKTIPVQASVVPEFPASVGIVMVVIIGLAILITRTRLSFNLK